MSIVIPCWNAETRIARAIQSVLDQAIPPVQTIVIDDGSTDGSLKIIKSFGNKVIWRTGPNFGASRARNIGLGLVTTEYVLFLDADDYIEGPYLEGMIRAAGQKPDIVFGPQFIEDRAGKLCRLHPVFFPSSREEALHLWVANTVRQTGAMMWRVAFLRSLGGWDESLVRHQDVELGLRGLIAANTIVATRQGRSVWCHHDSPFRICHTQNGAAAALGILGYLDRHLATLTKILSASGVAILALRYYDIARWLFQSGEYHAGRRALAKSRQLGYHGHKGNWPGRQISMLVGLEMRERLGRIKRGLIMTKNSLRCRKGPIH